MGRMGQMGRMGKGREMTKETDKILSPEYEATMRQKAAAA